MALWETNRQFQISENHGDKLPVVPGKKAIGEFEQSILKEINGTGTILQGNEYNTLQPAYKKNSNL